jgi:hypothetical protein
MSNLQKFNNTLHSFLSELLDKYGRGHGVCDEYFKNYYRDFLESPGVFASDTSFMLDYVDLAKSQLTLLKNDDVNILKHRVIDHVFFNNEDLELDATEINDIMRYYKVLYVYAYRHTYDGDVNDLLRNSMTGSLDMNVISRDDRVFLDIVESLKHNRTKRIEEQLEEKRENNETVGDGEGGGGGGLGGLLGGMLGGLGGSSGGLPTNVDMDPESIKKHMNKALPGAGKLLYNELGQVAMNIMKEIDLTNLDLGDPAKLLQSMMSGNIKGHKGLNNLVGNITNQIEKQIETGQINPDILKKEAETLVKDGTSGLGNITNMMENNGGFMKDMMSKMSGFMGDNVDSEQLQEAMKHMDNPDKIAELAQQIGGNQPNIGDMQNNIMEMLSGNTEVNSSEQTSSPAPSPSPAPVPSTQNDLASKQDMLNKLKRLQELKQKKASLH